MNARSRAGWIGAIGVACICAALIAFVQPGLAQSIHKVRQRDDVFLLPPPNQLRAMTLGYRAAATDLLWADFILEYGLHWQEKRAFPDATRYADGILALEPDFPTIYHYVDTILVYGPVGGTADDARKARHYLERGTQERPYDAEVWLQYGQFIAFLAPSFLKDEHEIERWRIEGATALTRAVELGADAQRSLAATTLLRRAGKQQESAEHLSRAYALTDDADVREQILLRINAMRGQALKGFEDQAEGLRATAIVEQEWRSRYGFLSRSQALLIGPSRSPTACAGPSSFERAECARDWASKISASR